MTILGRLAGLFCTLLMILSCSDAAVMVEPGVSLELARSRAALVSDLHYRLRFDIPRDRKAPIAAQAEISFDLADASAALPLDFREEPTNIETVYANGKSVDYQFINEHIVIPAAALHSGRNVLEVDFTAGESSLNRNPDYLYTLLVPDRARTLFPLFDQPDLKARYDLSLVVPEGWKAMSSAPVSEVIEEGGRLEYHFETSDLISSYLFSFVAGEFESITREVNGRLMTMFHRETDGAKLARNLDTIFDLHSSSIAWMEDYTGIEYPFAKFDFALIPSFPYGGMEHVGAIQYRAAPLLLDEAPSEPDLLGRAQLIAHETAHMWFGNLVTMKWFNDVWTKEVFASFMAGKIVNPGFAQINHDLNFLVSHYPPAYAIDRSQGANPIRQELANLNQAGQMYGSIIYHKAPIMMRQLELLVGETVFQQGMRKYLGTYAHRNATWPDLISILDAGSDLNLTAWSEVWVNTAGRPEFQLSPPEDPGQAAQLIQLDATGLDRVWPQQFEVLALVAGDQDRARLVTNESTTALPRLDSPVGGASYLFSADGYGYGLFPADMALFHAWPLLGDVEKGVALINSYENLLQGKLTGVEGYFMLLLDLVQTEGNQLLLELALGQMKYTYNSLLTDAQRARQRPVLESALWRTILAQLDRSRTRVFFRAYASLASSPQGLVTLRELWSGERVVDKLVLEEEDMLWLAQILAIRLPDESAAIVARQIVNTENPDRRRRLEFIAPSLSSDIDVRDAFFASLADVENRQTEPWVTEALSNLHHPARLDVSHKYLLPSLELLQEIQQTGDIFFPSDWLRSTLGNYRSASAVDTVRSFLSDRPDYNAQLRMKVLQAADPLFRASHIQKVQLAAGE